MGENKKLKSKISKLKKQRNLFLITTIVLPILALIIAVWQIKSSERIASDSGILDKPISELSFGGFYLKPLVNYQIFYGFDYTDKFVFHTLPFVIHSIGEKSMNETYLMFRYNINSNLCTDTFFSLESSFDTTTFNRYYSRVEPFEFSNYKFHSINPGLNYGIGELIYLNETIFNNEVLATTRDSVDLLFEYSLLYGKQFETTLTSEDMKAKNYQFGISGISVSKMEDLISYYKNQLIKKIENKTLTNNEYCFLVYPELLRDAKVDAEGETINFITTVANRLDNIVYAYYDSIKKKLIVLNQQGEVIMEERLMN